MSKRDWAWGPIPQNFEKITAADHVRLAVRSDVAKWVDVQTFLPGDSLQVMSSFQGREQLRSVHLKNGETALIRAYRHGGLFRKLTGKVFFTWPPRPFRELAITEEIRRRGIPTIEVYAACVAALRGPLYQGWLLTKELNRAQDLWTAFQTGLVRSLGVELVLAAVARTVKALHREGVYHHDLNLKNILVRAEPDGVKGYIIDFDRAGLMLGSLPAGLARKNLNRLLRSIAKLDPDRKLVSENHWQYFLNHYQRS